MLNLTESKQLITFADCGTLSKTASQLHLSQPTITRTMQHLEDAFNVPLFIRGKNKITLNGTGMQAVKYARQLVADAETAASQIQAFHARLYTIAVETCAPAPLWSLLPLLSAQFPQQTISSKLSEVPTISQNVAAGICDIGILPYHADSDELTCIPVLQEKLFVCIVPQHELANNNSLTFTALNGFNCLLRSQIGFWDELCHQKMPASRFLIQTDEFAFKELIKTSTLPCFTTDLVKDTQDFLYGRQIIPCTDPEANVTYHFLCRKKRPDLIALANQLRMQNRL